MRLNSETVKQYAADKCRLVAEFVWEIHKAFPSDIKMLLSRQKQQLKNWVICSENLGLFILF